MNKMVLIPHAKYKHLLKKSETPELSEAESQTEPLSLLSSRQEAEEEGQAVNKKSSSTPSESLATISASKASSASVRAPPGINYREELQGKGSILKQKKKKNSTKRKPVNFPERNIVNSWIHF